MNLLDPTFLFASLVWGSVGVGYFIYGKKQESLVPAIGGILMVVTAYFVSSAMLMSVVCVVIILAVHLLLRRGW